EIAFPGRWPGLTKTRPFGPHAPSPRNALFCGLKGRLTSAQANGLGPLTGWLYARLLAAPLLDLQAPHVLESSRQLRPALGAFAGERLQLRRPEREIALAGVKFEVPRRRHDRERHDRFLLFRREVQDLHPLAAGQLRHFGEREEQQPAAIGG